MNTLFELNGEIAVVIGGGGVLGGALAEGFASAGARVAILDLDRSRENSEARVKKIKDAGGEAKFFAGSATDRASLARAHQEIEAALGAPTILLNAAGGNDPKVTVTSDHPFEQIALDDWRANFELNLAGGALLPCQEFGSAMAKRGKGSIINIASVSAHLPLSRVVTYSAAKAALLNQVNSWPANGLLSAFASTRSRPDFFPPNKTGVCFSTKTDRRRTGTKSILGHTPMGRFGEAKELVGAAIFLASSAASGFVTGADLRVDGGFLSQTI